MQPQTDRNLAEARKVQQQLKAIFQLREGGRTDTATLHRVRALCAIASRTLNDSFVKTKMGQVEMFADALFSDRKHQRWTRQPLSGAAYLRRQVFVALDACDTRLQDIVAVRQSTTGSELEKPSGEPR